MSGVGSLQVRKDTGNTAQEFKYCSCGSNHNNNADGQSFCIECEKCGDWWTVHPTYVGFLEDEAENNEWNCPDCTTIINNL